MLDNIRDSLWKLHIELPKNGVVSWTSGIISALDIETGYVVIKPSGMRYEELRPEDMVIVDLNGQKIEGDFKPSSDTMSHLYIYRQRPDVRGVVHTHFPYATAFAALGKQIPVCLTAIAD
jgi:L-ribulose-5-phosphate 4-epimerase